MYILPKNSLRSQIFKQIKSNYTDLGYSRPNLIIKYFNYLSRRDKWWLVFINVVLLVFFSSFIELDFLSFVSFDQKTASVLIDQRTSNVATIISMTLAVIGLLLGNLAIKDNQTYKILFVDSKLYLILYYTLSIIFCLILLSTFRDTIEKGMFNRLVLSVTYYSLFILFGIGYLFRTIIKFANATEIYKILSNKVKIEVKENLKIKLLGKLSQETFENFMKESKIEYIDLSNAPAADYYDDKKEYAEELIYDINVRKLKNKITKGSLKMFYNTRISLNLRTNKSISFITYDANVLEKSRIDLKSCIIRKDPKKELRLLDEYSNYFDEKLKDYISTGRTEKVNEILTLYGDLLSLEIKNS